MEKGNQIAEKSYKFAIRIVRLYQYLCKKQYEFILSKQVVRSGTSIGANVEEGLGGQSRNDFVAKFQISLKEARETRYWLRLLRDTDYLEPKLANSLTEDAEELIKILISILRTTKDNSEKIEAEKKRKA